MCYIVFATSLHLSLIVTSISYIRSIYGGAMQFYEYGGQGCPGTFTILSGERHFSGAILQQVKSSAL